MKSLKRKPRWDSKVLARPTYLARKWWRGSSMDLTDQILSKAVNLKTSNQILKLRNITQFNNKRQEALKSRSQIYLNTDHLLSKKFWIWTKTSKRSTLALLIMKSVSVTHEQCISRTSRLTSRSRCGEWFKRYKAKQRSACNRVIKTNR